MESQQNSAEQNSQNIEELPVKPAVEAQKSNFLSSKWLRIGAVLVVSLVLLGGIYFLGKNNAKTKSTRVAQTTASTPTPTSDHSKDWQITKSDIRAGWNKYTNTKLSYSFEAPESWSKEIVDNGIDNLIRFMSPNFKGKKNEFPSSGSTIEISTRAATENSIVQYFSDQWDKPKGGPTKPNYQITKVDNQKAITYEITFEGDTVYTQFLHDGIVYSAIISFWDITGPNHNMFLKNDLPIYNQILSTFKFTDSSNSITANPGQHCGGNIATAKQCTSGYHCQLEKIADLGGICVKN